MIARSAACAALVALGLLHLAWGAGSAWPARDREALADAVTGSPEMPGAGRCFAVGGVLLAASAAVSTPGLFGQLARLGTAGLLAARAAAGGSAAARTVGLPPPSPSFLALDRRWYRPACAALAVLLIVRGGTVRTAR